MVTDDSWRRVVGLVILGLTTASLAGCYSLGGPPKALPTDFACQPDDGLTGVWKDRRMTQLGPAWVRLALRCDCTYAMRIQLLWMRIREEGVYRVEREELVLEGESGETRWPFELQGGRLSLEEYPGEVMDHRLASDLACRAESGAPG